jgi:hypothetical protein
MRNIFTFIISLLIFTSCKQTETETKDRINKYTELSKFYRDTTFSDIHIYPDTSSYENLSYFFRGNQIDSTTCKLLPATVTNSLPWTEGFHGILSFQINKDCIGLITRTPGMYASTAISLWIYDLTKDSITNNIQLADIFGDAGAAETINSSLFVDNQKQLKALIYRYYTYDHSIEDENDKTVEIKHSYYLVRINNVKTDTLEKDSIKLNQVYKDQLKKMASY